MVHNLMKPNEKLKHSVTNFGKRRKFPCPIDMSGYESSLLNGTSGQMAERKTNSFYVIIHLYDVGAHYKINYVLCIIITSTRKTTTLSGET